jgi:hypothetical protein
MGGRVLVAQAEPGRLGAVPGELFLDHPGLADAAPAALRVGRTAERVHDAVQVGADLQAVHPHVVADIDHRRDLGTDTPGVGTHAHQEPGATDSPGQDHDPHPTILAHRGRIRGLRVTGVMRLSGLG